MQTKHTQRGFCIVEFEDRYGISCSLQKSSLATEDAVWFGVNDANPKILGPAKGWIPVEMPDDYLANTRMHLTIDQVKELLPYLQFFVENGELPEKGELD